jgi:hypothetical protein
MVQITSYSDELRLALEQLGIKVQEIEMPLRADIKVAVFQRYSTYQNRYLYPSWEHLKDRLSVRHEWAGNGSLIF